MQTIKIESDKMPFPFESGEKLKGEKIRFLEHWQLQDAKSRFNEVIEKAVQNGLQSPERARLIQPSP
ncbi:Uncharacterized protein dnl_17270 [Desulfonema limicola]|uniref:Uncharacterized protein n=1 Tax=Desulfonema limicola TaxID=45656 RepID=A0A975B606_9BACT|nr:hypothetical protein [Desulfonema limicola]QTA79456.1 Uncharacterized protein dnl_17270 [Desulfonema limicola]